MEEQRQALEHTIEVAGKALKHVVDYPLEKDEIERAKLAVRNQPSNHQNMQHTHTYTGPPCVLFVAVGGGWPFGWLVWAHVAQVPLHLVFFHADMMLPCSMLMPLSGAAAPGSRRGHAPCPD